jgi:hypothetical protein
MELLKLAVKNILAKGGLKVDYFSIPNLIRKKLSRMKLCYLGSKRAGESDYFTQNPVSGNQYVARTEEEVQREKEMYGGITESLAPVLKNAPVKAGFAVV